MAASSILIAKPPKPTQTGWFSDRVVGKTTSSPLSLSHLLIVRPPLLAVMLHSSSPLHCRAFRGDDAFKYINTLAEEGNQDLLLVALILIAALRLDAASKLQIPFQFEVNRGQAASDVQFIARGEGYSILLRNYLKPDLAAPGRSRISLRGIPTQRTDNRAATAAGTRELSSRRGTLADGHPHVFSRVRQKAIYFGIDVVYYGNASRLEYDLEVAAGADPQKIAIQFDNIDNLSIDSEGNLHIASAGHDIVQHRPLVYQSRQPITGKYRLIDADTVGVEIGEYDHSQRLCD